MAGDDDHQYAVLPAPPVESGEKSLAELTSDSTPAKPEEEPRGDSSHPAAAPPPSKLPPRPTMPAAVAAVREESEDELLKDELLEDDSKGSSATGVLKIHPARDHLNSRSGCQ
jgi:hypothetical protein